MERWRRHEYKVSIFIKSSLQRIFGSDQKQYIIIIIIIIIIIVIIIYHHHREECTKTRWNIFTFLRQPTRLLILFRCSFSPFPSLPAKIPTLWKTIISCVEIKNTRMPNLDASKLNRPTVFHLSLYTPSTVIVT